MTFECTRFVYPPESARSLDSQCASLQAMDFDHRSGLATLGVVNLLTKENCGLGPLRGTYSRRP